MVLVLVLENMGGLGPSFRILHGLSPGFIMSPDPNPRFDKQSLSRFL